MSHFGPIEFNIGSICGEFDLNEAALDGLELIVTEGEVL